MKCFGLKKFKRRITQKKKKKIMNIQQMQKRDVGCTKERETCVEQLMHALEKE
jgi:hypothetical protein